MTLFFSYGTFNISEKRDNFILETNICLKSLKMKCNNKFEARCIFLERKNKFFCSFNKNLVVLELLFPGERWQDNGNF